MKSKSSFLKSKNPQAANRPLVCFIPGGPGISSNTLRSMDILSRSFDLLYIDPCGTGGAPEVKEPTFEKIVATIAAELGKYKRKFVVCGHSFGALYGIALLPLSDIESFFALCAPLSGNSYEYATEVYLKLRSADLKKSEEIWEKNPTSQNLSIMFSNYGEMYFSKKTSSSGSQMLAKDQGSSETFKHVLPVISQKEKRIDFVSQLKAASIPKYMVAASEDVMLPSKILAKDADATGSKCFTIQSAGHFVTFDQPEAVAELIEKIVIDSLERK